MPWNSVRYDVTEVYFSTNRRVMAWKTPAGKLVVAVTNRIGTPMGYRINLPSSKSFTAFQYDATPRNQVQADGTGQYKGKPLGMLVGSTVDMVIPNQAIQFLVEN